MLSRQSPTQRVWGVQELLPKTDFPNLTFLGLEGNEDDLDDPGHANNGLQMALPSLSDNLLHPSLQFNEVAPLMFRCIPSCARKVEVFDLNIKTYIEGDLALKQLEWTPTQLSIFARFYHM